METIDIKYVQEMELSILQQIDEICKKHNLRYFLIGGTLIGAARHNGFIPWDDDLDIAMFRDDYEKFVKIAKSELSSPYLLKDFRYDNNYPRIFAKVFKTDTDYCSRYYQEALEEAGIWIDVFPIDLIKAKNLKKAKQKAERRLNLSWVFAVIDENRNKENNELSIKTKMLSKILRPLPIVALRKMMVKIYMLDNKKKCKYITNYCRGVKAQTMPIECYLPGKYLPFEGQDRLVPQEYHQVLTNSYGDYMKLPDKEEQAPKHDLVKKNK
ncbi:MAG: LicD family protein [Clostridia bacterium]|nr:LicD family protein [Clostridia bacterium]